MAPAAPPPAPLQVTVVGGYLGAGKTTLVNSLLHQADGRRLAVMVNEFGDLPIDSSLIEAADDRIVSLAGGCICCSYGEDLVSGLAMLTELSPRPDHVLIEASGVAFPGAIAGTVGLLASFALDGTVVLADAETVRRLAADRYLGSTVRRQLAEADLILLNKCDLAADPDALQAWLGEHAPGVRIVPTVQAEAPIDVVLGTRPDSHVFAAGGQHAGHNGDRPHGHAHDHDRDHDHDHTGGYATATLDPPPSADPAALARALADPALNLLRAKGFVRRPDGAMAAVQVVGNRWAVADAAPDAPAGLVCIGLRDRVDPAAIRRSVAACALLPPPGVPSAAARAGGMAQKA